MKFGIDMSERDSVAVYRVIRRCKADVILPATHIRRGDTIVFQMQTNFETTYDVIEYEGTDVAEAQRVYKRLST